MKKETLIAIILGIGAGIGIAFFLVQQSGNSPKNNNVILDKITPTVSINTSDIEPLIIQSPESELVTDQSTIELTVAAPQNSLIVIQTLTDEIVFENDSGTFSEDIDLVPGENIIKITSYKDKNIDTRSLVIYSVTSSLGSSKDAGDEANNTSQTEEDSTIKSLKEKIEKKVDELSQGNKNVIVGHITELKEDTMLVKTDTDDEYTVALDSTITEMYKVTIDEKESIDFEDLEKDDRVIVSGPSIEKQISANIIYVQQDYLIAQGQIVSTDSSAFTIDVITTDKDQYTLDVEEDTVQLIMSVDTLKLAKTGFTKIKNGDRIHFAMIRPEGKITKAEALRILIIPQEFFSEDKEKTEN